MPDRVTEETTGREGPRCPSCAQTVPQNVADFIERQWEVQEAQLARVRERLDEAVKEASHGATANPQVIDKLVAEARDLALPNPKEEGSECHGVT